MFNVGDELLYEGGGIYVKVLEVHDEHMVVEDMDDGWEVTVPDTEYDLYTPCEDENELRKR